MQHTVGYCDCASGGLCCGGGLQVALIMMRDDTVGAYDEGIDGWDCCRCANRPPEGQ